MPVTAQGQGAGLRPVEEDSVPRRRDRVLPPPLQGNDPVDEACVTPWLGTAEGDDVCRGFLDDRMPADLQQAQDGCLPGAGSTGENV